MKRSLAVAVAFALLPPSAAWAQRIEASLLGTFTTSSHIDQKAQGIEDLKIDGGFAWGANVMAPLTNHVAAEALWTWQHTGLTLAPTKPGVTLFYMNVNQLDGNVVYQFGEPSLRLRPFVFGGLGVSILTADGIDTTKMAWNAGAGVKWLFSNHFGARFDGRYRPTLLNSSSTDYCAPFEFCQTSLRSFQFDSALLMRF